MEKNTDTLAKKGVTYSYNDISTTSSEDAYSNARHYLKHLGIPQDSTRVGLFKRAYELILQAFTDKKLCSGEYMLLYTNRLNVFFNEYYPNEFVKYGAGIVESTRLVIVWMYFIKTEILTQEFRNYFEDWHQLVLNRK
jgi:hypothetical protein